jgi:hypothetical protein
MQPHCGKKVRDPRYLIRSSGYPAWTSHSRWRDAAVWWDEYLALSGYVVGPPRRGAASRPLQVEMTGHFSFGSTLAVKVRNEFAFQDGQSRVNLQTGNTATSLRTELCLVSLWGPDAIVEADRLPFSLLDIFCGGKSHDVGSILERA